MPEQKAGCFEGRTRRGALATQSALLGGLHQVQHTWRHTHSFSWSRLRASRPMTGWERSHTATWSNIHGNMVTYTATWSNIHSNMAKQIQFLVAC